MTWKVDVEAVESSKIHLILLQPMLAWKMVLSLANFDPVTMEQFLGGRKFSATPLLWRTSFRGLLICLFTFKNENSRYFCDPYVFPLIHLGVSVGISTPHLKQWLFGG